jgi:hypothetical protein
MIDHTTSTCEKCQEVFPTIIHTCWGCKKIVVKSRGAEMIHSNRTLCVECYTELSEQAWKYRDLCK